MKHPNPPPWLADLHGPGHHPGLAACRWEDDEPILSIDVRKLRILAARGCCWLCGFPVSTPGYVVVTESDVTNRYGALHTSGSGPVHRSCALYACAVCPFLKYGKSRRRVTGDGLRGAASIKGFTGWGIFFPPDPNIFCCFGYFNPTETIPLTSQAQVADLYEQAVTTDAELGFSVTPRAYWTDAADDRHRLNVEWSETWQRTRARAQLSVTINGHPFYGYTLTQRAADVADTVTL